MINFNQSTYGVMEGDGTLSIHILLSQPSSVPFQVLINTIDVTAEGTFNLAITYVCTCVYNIQTQTITLGDW